MKRTAFIPAATVSVVAQVFAGQSYDDHPGRIVARRRKIKEVMKRYSWYRHGKHASA